VIRYQLRCGRGHGFEGWFKNMDAYADDVLTLDCPVCGDRTIEKAIMAPAVLQRTTGSGADEPAEGRSAPAAAGTTSPSAPAAAPEPERGTAPVAAPVAAVPAAPISAQQAELAKAMLLMRRLRAHVEATFEHVGDRFAEEARKIHHEETEPRGIYGEATREEILSLEEEGISVAPLPNLPKLDG
jgi:hypothetical protein